jgi:hypothetical protein
MMMPVFLSRLLALMIPVGTPGARQESSFPIASLPHNLTILFLRDSKATAPLNPFLISSYLFSSSLFFFIFFFFFFFPFIWGFPLLVFLPSLLVLSFSNNQRCCKIQATALNKQHQHQQQQRRKQIHEHRSTVPDKMLCAAREEGE